MKENTLPTIILVHGFPCSGKTTVARQIARKFNLPLFQKDGIKEILYDTVGWGDRQRSRQLGYASVELLFYLINAVSGAGKSAVVDCNFHPEFDNARLKSVLKENPFTSLQVLCWAEGDILLRRFKERTGKRHPGHGDHTLIDEIEPLLMSGKANPLDTGGNVYWMNTSDFNQIDYAQLYGWIISLSRETI